MTRSQKDYWSDGTTITAGELVAWIRDSQSVCRPGWTPMPAWFYPKVAEIVAPTVRDVTIRRHRNDDDRPFTAEETREAVARSAALRIFRIWRRVRLGDLACRRCGGTILGEDFVFEQRGAGPYDIWHSECHALQQTDPQPVCLRAPRARQGEEEYRRELQERNEMIRAERHHRRKAAELRRQTCDPGSSDREDGCHDRSDVS
jgi:hypothetical protein